MKCPNCGVEIHLWTDSCEISTEHEKIDDPIVSFEVGFCPACQKPIVDLKYGFIRGHYPDRTPKWNVVKKERIYPVYTYISPLDDVIPGRYADEYYESCRVLPISP